jgi:hypothetical protein
MFRVGILATHIETGTTRVIRHMRLSPVSGEQLLGFGRRPTGFCFAKDYKRYKK